MSFLNFLGVPPNLDAAEGAVAALAKVCEDSCEALARVRANPICIFIYVYIYIYIYILVCTSNGFL